MDVDTMTGKELGIALAEQVMGWQECDPHKIEAAGRDRQALGDCYPCWRDVGLSSYPCWRDVGISRLMVFFIADTVEGTSRYWAPWRLIADAWEVVEKLESLGYWVRIKSAMDDKLEIRGWAVDVGKLWNREGFGVWAETAPCAICRAALKAVT